MCRSAGARRPWWAVALAAVLLAGAPRALQPQVFELQGGGSSLYQGYGGALNVWGERFEGNLGIGYLDGLRFSVFLKHLIGRDTLRIGNDAIPVRLTTDVFGGSHAILAQGVGVRRTSKRSSIYAFAGASASATPAPFVSAVRHDRAIGVIQAERILSPAVRVSTHALLSGRQTILQGLAWKSPRGVEAAATAGIGGNQPYGSASFAVRREMLDLRASFIGMGNSFRRTGVPTPAQTEADRDNFMITLRPAPGFSFGAARQHFRQDSTRPGSPDRATLHQVYGSARVAGLNLAAGVFDSRTPGTRNLSSYVSTSRDVTRWLQADLYLLQVWSPEPVRSATPVLHLREFVSPRVSLLQVLTRANGRTTMSVGGAVISGLTSLGLDYHIVHTPYRPTRPFVQTVALNVRLPLGNYRVNAASFVGADGRVSYAGAASTFFYAGDVMAAGARPVEIRFERYIVEGRVVDESGGAIDGAAIAVGTSTVFTDSQGRFFVRFSHDRAVEVRVLTDEFLASGRYEVVSVPSSATPKTERESAPLRVVLRRRALNVPLPDRGPGAVPPPVPNA